MTRFRHHRRRGLTTMMAVFVLTILMIAAVFSYSVFSTRDSYIELRNASQASSLAGVGTLAHDDLLTGNTSRILARLTVANSSAVQVAEANQLKGLMISMDPQNPTNDPTGNIVFGQLDKELGGTFTPFFPLPAPADPMPFDSARLNAVRVEVVHPKRPGVKVKMYAHIDHNIIGFKPTNAVNAPVIPIALFSSPAIPALNTFENALLTATDTANLNYTTNVFNAVPGPDGIPEVRFEFGVPSGDPTVISVRNLNIGATTWADAQVQVASGITVANVSGLPFGGQFTLADPIPSLSVPEFLPSPTLADFAASFAPVSTPNAAIPRVFPLYSGIDGSGNVIVTGFVAARVVSVDTSDASRVTVTIQPTLISSPLAVTPTTCPVPAGAPSFNRYIGKLRIAATMTDAP
jgi:hypothetical protein